MFHNILNVFSATELHILSYVHFTTIIKNKNITGKNVYVKRSELSALTNGHSFELAMVLCDVLHV